MNKRPPIPEPDKRTVRKECYFGCAICGNPLIVYAHIVPYSISHDNSPENLVSLCPDHHTEYDRKDIPVSKIKHYRANPFNKGARADSRLGNLTNSPFASPLSNVFGSDCSRTV